MSRKKKVIIGVSVVVLLGAITAANFAFKKTSGVTVNTEAIQKRRLEAIVNASGKIQPKTLVNISADTSGRVTELAVEEGQRVTKGQFLLQIDPRNLRTRVQSGEASLAAAQSQLEQLRLALEGTKVALQQAEDAAKRQRDLWKQGLTTREALDRAEADLKQRQAELRTQEQQLQTQRMNMQREQATLQNAQFDFQKVRIESPIDGIVTRRNIEAGETAIIGTMNNPGTVLLTIADMSVIEAEVDVDETEIPNVKLGQPAKITIDAMPGQTFSGKVTEIGNSPTQTTATAATQATNFKVVITLESQIPEVRPGFTCTADITTAVRENALAVPIQALAVREVTYDDKGTIVRQPKDQRTRPRGSGIGTASADELPKGHTRKEEEGVFVVREGLTEFVPVKTGIAGDKYFEVLAGLKEGDAVITGPFNSVRNLKDGDSVKPTPAAPASR
jgi:HlyD family secretion protein